MSTNTPDGVDASKSGSGTDNKKDRSFFIFCKKNIQSQTVPFFALVIAPVFEEIEDVTTIEICGEKCVVVLVDTRRRIHDTRPDKISHVTYMTIHRTRINNRLYLFLFFVFELDHQFCLGAAMEADLTNPCVSDSNTISGVSKRKCEVRCLVTFLLLLDLAGLGGGKPAGGGTPPAPWAHPNASHDARRLMCDQARTRATRRRECARACVVCKTMNERKIVQNVKTNRLSLRDGGGEPGKRSATHHETPPNNENEPIARKMFPNLLPMSSSLSSPPPPKTKTHRRSTQRHSTTANGAIGRTDRRRQTRCARQLQAISIQRTKRVFLYRH